jgi:hypothetical protein
MVLFSHVRLCYFIVNEAGGSAPLKYLAMGVYFPQQLN